MYPTKTQGPIGYPYFRENQRLENLSASDPPFTWESYTYTYETWKKINDVRDLENISQEPPDGVICENCLRLSSAAAVTRGVCTRGTELCIQACTSLSQVRQHITGAPTPSPWDPQPQWWPGPWPTLQEPLSPYAVPQHLHDGPYIPSYDPYSQSRDREAYNLCVRPSNSRAVMPNTRPNHAYQPEAAQIQTYASAAHLCIQNYRPRPSGHNVLPQDTYSNLSNPARDVQTQLYTRRKWIPPPGSAPYSSCYLPRPESHSRSP